MIRKLISLFKQPTVVRTFGYGTYIQKDDGTVDFEISRTERESDKVIQFH